MNTYCRLKWILSILQVQTFEDGPVRLKTVNNFLSERSDSKNTPILIYAPGFQNIRARMIIEILSRNHWSLKWGRIIASCPTRRMLWTVSERGHIFYGQEIFQDVRSTSWHVFPLKLGSEQKERNESNPRSSWIGSILFWSKNSVVSFPLYFLRDLDKFDDRWFSKP